jgi:hypothetical protein
MEECHIVLLMAILTVIITLDNHALILRHQELDGGRSIYRVLIASIRFNYTTETKLEKDSIMPRSMSASTIVAQ